MSNDKLVERLEAELKLEITLRKERETELKEYQAYLEELVNTRTTELRKEKEYKNEPLYV